ncbi:acyl-CoA dehydrogenase family protein [Streptomyces sp. NPDC091377]|uniref:acyl-CoA dehydrogenase family protein n=1 Tax=unclassified Streptomyces TaxID=2593676 RepID=UPI0037F8F8ED
MSYDGPTTIVHKAARVAEVAARHADEAEDARRLSLPVVDALREAGFARHFVPAAYGGEAGAFGELTSAVSVVGEGCTSAAWAASLAAYAGRYAAFLPEKGQSELWADGPDALLAAALMPSGTAERVSGGWTLDGEWKYISGIHFADWALACAPVPDEGPADGGRPPVRYFAVPRGDLTIVDSWNPVGMRGTGSDTLTLSGVYVPEHRTLARSDVHEGRAPASDARCHIVPMYAVNALPFAVPLIGAARGALRGWTARTVPRVDRRGRSVAEQPATQVVLARSAAEIDAAELLIHRTAAFADGTETLPEAEAAVRGPRDLALAVDLLVSAVDRVYRASGTSGQSVTDPVQRFWRDVNSAASHVALSFETTGAAYGAWALAEGGPERQQRR